MSKSAVAADCGCERDFDSAINGGLFFLHPSPNIGKTSLKGKETNNVSCGHSAPPSHSTSLFPDVSISDEPLLEQKEQLSPNTTSLDKNNREDSYNALGPLNRSRSTFAVPFEDVWFGPLLGFGLSGEVYSARWMGKEIAIKVYDIPFGDESLEAVFPQTLRVKIQRETEFSITTNSSHFVAPLGFCEEPPCILMETFSRGSLFEIIERAREDPSLASELTWGRRLRMLSDAAAGMASLHEHKPAILHRNLKPTNLLVDYAWKVKVSDLAFFVKPTAETLSVDARWLAGEVLEKGEWITASDVYSFGVILWHMLTWELPWSHLQNENKICSAVLRGDQLPLPDRSELPGPAPTCDRTYIRYYRLMNRCMEEYPENRPEFMEILRELTGMATKEKE